MADCGEYLKKFYLGVGVFFIMVIMRTFFILPTELVIILGFVLLVTSLILVGPYLKCLEKNLKK